MTAKIVAIDGERKGAVIELEAGEEWVAGRDPDSCNIIIEDPAVSRKHLLFRKTPEGMTLENLSQTNPALVNGEEIATAHLLKAGDKITLGNTTYGYESGHGLEEQQDMEEHQETSEDAMNDNPISQDAVNEDASHHDEALPHTEDPQPQEEVMEHEDEALPHEEEKLFDDTAPSGKDALAEINFEVIETGRWLLKVVGGPNNGAEFSMQASNNYTIGTDPNSCDIVFHDNSVSRQHARISITSDDKLYIEDLKSRNGTLVDGEPLKTKKALQPNIMITIGTSSFIVYDREGEMQTIISPLLPSIVKVLQKEEPKKDEAKEALKAAEAKQKEMAAAIAAAAAAKEKAGLAVSSFIVVGILTALVVIIGIGTASLFKGEPVVKEEQVDYNKTMEDVMLAFPSIKWSFNKATGRLLLLGHVLTATDKNQLLYNLQGLNFIRSYDDNGVIIDEYVWQEINQLLSNNPNWKGITVTASSPGQFVLQGYLQTRKQAEQLSQYIAENFRYLDLLKKSVVIEEDVVARLTTDLQNLGMTNLAVQISNGEVTISGALPTDKMAAFNTLLADFRKVPGVHLIKNYVTAVPEEQAFVDISDKYSVTGYSKAGDNINIVINGRILMRGDTIDGMLITDIESNTIMLEKDRVKYRIMYSR